MIYFFRPQLLIITGAGKRRISLTKTTLKNAKDHWHTLARKQTGSMKALEHFDDFYKSIFRLKWPSVRLALLSPQKYVALVNNFGDVAESEKLLTNMGAMELNLLFDACQKNAKTAPEEEEEEQESTPKEVFTLDRVIDEKIRMDEELDRLYPSEALANRTKSEEIHEEVTESNENIADQRFLFYEYDRIVHPDHSGSGSLHDFIPASKLKGLEDYIPESEYYSYYKSSSDVPIETEKCHKLNYPKHWKVFTFDRGDVSMYPPPKRSATGALNYFLMDGASLLPVLVLDVKPGDKVLDMCAAPGGKSLAILQTMAPELLVCNDLSTSRVQRIHKVLQQYLYDYSDTWKSMLQVQKMCGTAIEGVDSYDKVLVDVPCTNDRISLHDDDNNYFKQNRIKERLRLPESQAGLLTNALRLVKPGGAVVYSTCSLSPIQNDGVVAMSLRRLWEEQRLRFTIMDMTPALSYTSHLFNYGRDIGLKFGHLVVPFLPSNFGPMYFCKIVKNT